MAQNEPDALVTFDNFSDSVQDTTENFVNNLIDKEMGNIVTLLYSVSDNSLDNFEPQNPAHHKQVSDAELDRLSDKNSTQ